MRNDGYNPIRYSCTIGCYLEKNCPKVEWFADIFPGKISFSDMDRIVEMAGRGLVFEWKGPNGTLSFGQELMWKRLTRGQMVTTIAVEFASDPSAMGVQAYRICFDGKWHDWVSAGLVDLRDKIAAWASWAQRNPVFSVTTNKQAGQENLGKTTLRDRHPTAQGAA